MRSPGRLRAVQMAQRHIIRPGKHGGGNRFDPARPDQRPLTVTALRPGNKSVGDHHPPRPGRHLCPGRSHLRSQNILRCLHVGIGKTFTGGVLIDKGHPGEHHRPMGIVQDQRRFFRTDGPPHQRPAGIGEGRHCLNPVPGIVISGDHHHRSPGFRRHTGQKSVELPDRTGWRGSAVKQITCQKQHIDVVLDHCRHDLIKDGGMILFQRQAVELSPQMKI